MKKIYYDNGSICDECFIDLGLDVFNSDENECMNYVDDNELCNIIDDTINNIEDSEICKKLNEIGIYLNINYSFDKTIWSDYDNNYFDW